MNTTPAIFVVSWEQVFEDAYELVDTPKVRGRKRR
jgi:hypothetical protein